MKKRLIFLILPFFACLVAWQASDTDILNWLTRHDSEISTLQALNASQDANIRSVQTEITILNFTNTPNCHPIFGTATAVKGLNSCGGTIQPTWTPTPALNPTEYFGTLDAQNLTSVAASQQAEFTPTRVFIPSGTLPVATVEILNTATLAPSTVGNFRTITPLNVRREKIVNGVAFGNVGASPVVTLPSGTALTLRCFNPPRRIDNYTWCQIAAGQWSGYWVAKEFVV